MAPIASVAAMVAATLALTVADAHLDWDADLEVETEVFVPRILQTVQHHQVQHHNNPHHTSITTQDGTASGSGSWAPMDQQGDQLVTEGDSGSWAVNMTTSPPPVNTTTSPPPPPIQCAAIPQGTWAHGNSTYCGVVHCDPNYFQNPGDPPSAGCMVGCPLRQPNGPVAFGACERCSAPDVCTKANCDDSHFDLNQNATDGCEAGCFAVDYGRCTSCPFEPTNCQTVLCQPNRFDGNGKGHDGCELGCPSVYQGQCEECSTAVTCTNVTCAPNFFNVNMDATDGCEAGCPSIGGGTCLECSSAYTCTTLTCDASRFDLNNDATDGCEAGCAEVAFGTCATCVARDTCTGNVTCLANRFDANQIASDGCEAGCPSVPQGACTACSSPSTCTAVQCAAGFADANGDASDGCEVPMRCDSTNSRCGCGVNEAVVASGQNLICAACPVGYHANADTVPTIAARTCLPNKCVMPTTNQSGYILGAASCNETTTGKIMCQVQPTCAAGYNAVSSGITDSAHTCDAHGGSLTFGGCAWSIPCSGNSIGNCVCAENYAVIVNATTQYFSCSECAAGYTRPADLVPATKASSCDMTICDGTNAACGCSAGTFVAAVGGNLNCMACAAGYTRTGDTVPRTAADSCSVRTCDGTNALCGCGADVSVTQDSSTGFLSCGSVCPAGYTRAVDTSPLTSASPCVVKLCDATNKTVDSCGCEANFAVVANGDILSCSPCSAGYERAKDLQPVNSAQTCDMVVCDGSNGQCGCGINEAVVSVGTGRLDCRQCPSGYSRSKDTKPVTSPSDCMLAQCDNTTSYCGCGQDTAVELDSVTGKLTCSSTCAAGFSRPADTAPRAFPDACKANPCEPAQVANSVDEYGWLRGVTNVNIMVTCKAGFHGGGTFTCGADGKFSGTACSANTCTLPTAQAGYNVTNIQCTTTTGTIECTTPPTCLNDYEGTPGGHTCDTNQAALTLKGCTQKKCSSYTCPAGKAVKNPSAAQTDDPETVCCAADCQTAFFATSTCNAGFHPKHKSTTTGADHTSCCTADITNMCVGNTISGCIDGVSGCTPALLDVACETGTHPKFGTHARTGVSGVDASGTLRTGEQFSCCDLDVTDQCTGNTVSGTDGSTAANADIDCGTGRTAKAVGTIGRNLAACCDDINECTTPSVPNCGGVGTRCTDVKAGPLGSTGYLCSCQPGYSGSDFVLNGPATCSPDPCDANPVIANINGAVTKCAGKVSGSSCAITCDTGYAPSGVASCTTGQYSTVTCDQQYSWKVVGPDFATCGLDCGTSAVTLNRSVSCIGKGDGTTAPNPGECQLLKPALQKSCGAIGVNHTCDDSDDKTMKDKCITTTTCQGINAVASEAMFPLDFAVYTSQTQAVQQAFLDDVCAKTLAAASAAGMIAECGGVSAKAGSTVTKSTMNANPTTVNTTTATGLTNNAGQQLASVQVNGTSAGNPTVQPVMVYSYVATPATCPTCEPRNCTGLCAQPPSVKEDIYACFKNEVGGTPTATLDSDCADNNVYKPTPPDYTTCAATPTCVTYQWYAPNFEVCPTACGSPAETKTRAVICKGSDNLPGPASKCSGTAPPSQFSCPAVECVTYAYVTGNYTPASCPTACGTSASVRTRPVTCQDSDGGVVPTSMWSTRCGNQLPGDQLQCGATAACTYTLNYSAWEPLHCPRDVPCDTADSVKTRTVVGCVKDETSETVHSSLCLTNPALSYVCTNPVCPAPATAVVATLTLNVDITTIPVGSTQRQTFVTNFKAGVATMLSVDATRIQVNSITAGSVKVNFAVLPPADGSANIAVSAVTSTFTAGVAITGVGTTTAAVDVTADPAKYNYTLSSDWNACITSCGQSAVTLTRNVTCNYDGGAVVAGSMCSALGLTKPAVSKTCAATSACAPPQRPGREDGAFSAAPSLLLGMLGLVLAHWW